MQQGGAMTWQSHVPRRLRTSGSLISALGLLLASCGGSPRANDVQVMSFAPKGPIEKTEPITIRFDKPVVDEAMVGKPADPRAIAVSPAFAWTGHWQDQRTLVIDPSAKLAPSTRYEITLSGELGKRTADFKFSFVHQPLVVEGLWGELDGEMMPPAGPIPLGFNQPVVPADVVARCKLSGPDDVEIPMASLSASPAAQVSLRPARPLEPGVAYTVVCAELAGAGGNTALDKPYTLSMRARPLPGVTSIEPGGHDVFADEVGITVTFATPVTLDAARRALSSTPAIPRLANGDLSEDGMTYSVTTDLESETSYQLKVAGLTDSFGQALAKPHEHTFRTGNGRPRISMERGIYALEASAKGYPLWSRAVGKFELECAAVPKHRVVAVLTGDMNYDPWGGYNDEQPLDWKKLKLTAKKATFRPSGKRWVLNELELGKQCGGPAGGRGVYLAEVSSDEITPDANRGWLNPRRNRVLANVTDLGVLLKVGASSGVIWVTSLSGGAPVGEAKVTVFDPEGKQVWTGATDADGLARIPGSAVLIKAKPRTEEEMEHEWYDHRSQRLIAVVEKAGDTAIVDGNWSNGIQIWNFGVTEDRRGGATKIRGFIQSDRGLYRPGERVHFKGIVREIAAGRPPRVPAGKKVDVEIQDSRGETVLKTAAKLSGFGGFAFDLPLGADAALGDYYVRARLGDQVFREKFSVEEFRAATFELALKSTTPSPRPGQQLAFELDAKYLFGAPVADANVDWHLRKRDHVLRFAGYESYSFSADSRAWWWRDDDHDYGEFVSEGNGTTDARGRLAITAKDDAEKFTGPVDYILSATVRDEADQTMGKSLVLTAHKTSLYLGLFSNEYVQAVNMPFGINVVALRPDGARTAAKAKLSFVKHSYTCDWNRVGARAFERCTSSEKKVLEREISIAGAGSHTERIFPTEPGSYVVKVEAKDDRGNAVVAASDLYVIGKGEAFWSGDEGDRMTLIASKPSFKVGETARLVPQANLVKPTALITIERDGVMEARIKKLGSPAEGLELPIADAWAPNVYASVALVSGRQGAGDAHRPKFKVGVVELAVSAAHKQLDVGIALDQDKVRPGDKVSGKIKVTSGGAPVKAEVSLSAADEGVLQLISYLTPNPMKTFYASYGLGVDSATNWNRVARLADPEAGDPDVGGDGGSTLDGQRVRSKFVASAYWAPMLVTDERGEVAFSFTAPDNLTAFRLMAVAADVGDRFGAGERRLTVNQPLMAVPALPRFLRAGDAASVGVVVHNHTDAAGTATVTAKADGAALAGTATQTVAVPANGSARVRFAAKASERAQATFEFAVAMGKERDAVRVTLPIDRPRVIDRRLVVEKRLGAGEAWTGSLGVAADVLRDESTLAIHADRSGLGDLAPSLRSLVEYPYGCLEQTMSRFLPLVAAKDIARTIDDPTLQGGKAAEFIQAGLAKVLRHQQPDGHFSLWPQSSTYPHLTAYALWGLTVAERAGEKVPADVFDRGVAALGKWANGAGNLRPNGDGATIAMAAYVMALRGKADAGLNARLYAMRAGLPKWGQSFLLRAMKLAKAAPAELAELQRLIASGIAVANGRATVAEARGYDHSMHMSSDVRAAAMTLAALLEVEPGSAMIDPLVAGLKAARDRSGAWVSTQDNLWSLVALAQYGRRSAAGDTTVVITAGGKELARRKLVGGEIAVTRVSLGALAGDDLKISADKGAVITARVSEARVDAGAAVANGFSVARRYVDAAGKEATSFKAGELVTVKLTVTADAARRWVALVDPIPAGFEVVNPKLAAGGAPQPGSAPGSRPSYWQAVTWDHQEMRDDRVLWFADHMNSGSYELEYQARATIDGTFTTMPATIEAMYEPELRARTPRAQVTVTP